MDEELLGGRFRRTTLLGTGAMGQVWLAMDERLQRMVAVKVVNPDSSDRTVGERFAREARAAAAVQHVNVVRVFDFIEEQNQTLIVMEHVDGETLKDRLMRGPMQQDVAAEIVAQVCDGLAAAHRLNLVHRDLKPANVMLTHDGIAKVVDFGLAKRTDNGDATLTSTGMVLGTPQYMAPEQFTADDVDGRTDVHAAGMLLYELLCGSPTYSGETLAQLMFCILSADAPLSRLAPHGVSAEVISVIAVALQKNPADRWQSASEMAQALRFAAFGEGTRAQRAPRATPVPVSERAPGTISYPALRAITHVAASTHASLSTSQAIALAIRSAIPRGRIRAAAVVAGIAAVIAGSVRMYAGGAVQPAAATVPSPDTMVIAAAAAATPPIASPPPRTTSARSPVGESDAPMMPAPQAPTTDTRIDPDRELLSRDASDRAVRATLAAEVSAKWRVFAASLGTLRGNGSNMLRASFFVVLDASGNLTDISPDAMSGVTAYDNMAAEAIQNVNRIPLGSASSATGWRFRVQMSGKSVRVVR